MSKKKGGVRFDSHAGRCAMECSSSKSAATASDCERKKKDGPSPKKSCDVAFAFAALSTTLTAGTTPHDQSMVKEKKKLLEKALAM